MKKIFTTFLTTAAVMVFGAVTAAAFAHEGEHINKVHHGTSPEKYMKAVNYNEGYTGAEAQAAGGYANANRIKSTRGGFITDDTSADEASNLTTVLNAKRTGDGTYVKLKGKIISKIGNEKYMFKDSTGTIQIEIDNDDWNGVKASPKDLVIIEGEIDKDWNEISIDVDTIELVK